MVYVILLPKFFKVDFQRVLIVQIKILNSSDLIFQDFKTNPYRIFAAHELVTAVDPACCTKMTVQVKIQLNFQNSKVGEQNFTTFIYC